MRGPLGWAWRRVLSDPVRLSALAGLLLAAIIAAALPMAADGALAQALASALRRATAAGSRPGTAALAIRFVPRPGAVPLSPALPARLQHLAARAGPLAGVFAGPVVLSAASRPLPAFALAPAPPGSDGAPRSLGRVRLVAVAGLAARLHWQAGGPFAPVLGAGRVLEVGVSQSFAVAERLGPGDVLVLGSARAPVARLRVVGVFAAASPGLSPHPIEVAVSFRLFAHEAGPPALPPAELTALVPLDVAALGPGDAGRAYRGLTALATVAQRSLPGAALTVSPRAALLAFLNRRALWVRQLAFSAAPALLCALGLALLAGWVAVDRDREHLGLWLTRGAAPAALAASYLAEWLAMALVAAAAGPPLAAWALRGAAPGGLAAAGLSPFLWALAPGLAGALGALTPLASVLFHRSGPNRVSDRGGRLGSAWAIALGLAAGAFALALYGALAAATAVGRAAPAAVFGTRPWDPLALAPTALFLLPVGLLAGAAFGLPLAARALLARPEARRAPAGLPALLALRALLRPLAAEAAALGLLALAVGAALFAASASASYRETAWRQAVVRVGAPVRVREEIPAACDTLVALGGERCLKGGVEVPAPAASGPSPSWLPWPVPPDPNPGIPGVAAASRVFLLTLPDWPTYSQTVRYLLLDPQTYATAALWPAGRSPAAALRALRRHPGQVLLVGGPAAAPGVVAGDYVPAFPCLVFAPDCPPRVAAATAGPWPGAAPAGPPLFVGAYGAAGPVPDLPPSGVRVTSTGFAWRAPLPLSWPLAPLSWDELLRLRPGVRLAGVLAALRARGVRVLSVERPGGVAAADLARPAARGRLALWRIDRWSCLTAALLLGLSLLAWRARRRGRERRLLSALGAGAAHLRLAAWLEGVAGLGTGITAGSIAGAAAARLCDPWLVALSSHAPMAHPATVLPHPWLPAWCALATALAWAVLDLAGGRLAAGGRRDGDDPHPDRRGGDRGPAPAGRPASASGLHGAWSYPPPFPVAGPSLASRAVAPPYGVAALAPGVALLPSGPSLYAPARAAARLWTRAAVAARARGLAAVWLVAGRWRAAPREVAVLGLALALSAWVGAAAATAAGSALSAMLRGSLTPQHGRPAGAVLLLQNAGGPGGVVQSSAPAVLASAAGALPALTGLPATPTVTVTETVSMPLFPEQDGRPAGGPPLAVVQLDAQPGIAAHVALNFGRLPSASPGPHGGVEGAVTASAARQMGLIPGGTYALEPAPGYGPPLLRLHIVGVFTPAADSAFWPYRSLGPVVFVAPGALERLAQAYPRAIDLISAYRVLAVRRLTPGRAVRAEAGLARVQAGVDLPGGNLLAASPLGELQAYLREAARLRAVLRLLAAPALAAALLLAALAADGLRRAGGPAADALQARGAPGAAFLAAAGGLLPLGAVAVLVGAAVAGALEPPSHVNGGLLARVVAALLPPGAAWAGAALATAAALAAAALVLWPLSRHAGAVPARRALAARPPRYPGIPLLLSALFLGVTALAAVRLHAGPVRAALSATQAPLVAFVLATLLVLGVGLGLMGLARLGAAWVERRWGQGLALGPLLVARRFSRSPGRWSAAWLLAVLAVGQSYAVAGAGRSLRLYRQAAAGLAAGADAALAEGWTAPCGEMPPYLPAPRGQQVSPYQRFHCVVGNRPWGTSAFAYQLPPPPPAPFAVNRALPGVLAATRLLERAGTVAVPGGPARAAEVVGVDPASYPAAAWWRVDINPLSLGAYMAGVGLGRVFAGEGWVRAAALRPGQVLELTVNGRTLPVTLGGPVRVWPGVDAQGTLVVGDAVTLRRDFSLKPVAYLALLRLRPRTDQARLAQALQARGLFVIDSTARAADLGAVRAAPASRALSALLAAVLPALALAGALGFLLLVLLRAGGPADLALLRALGVERADLAAAARMEIWLLGAGGAVGGLLAGVSADRLLVPLLGVLSGVSAGGAPLPGVQPLPAPAGAAPFVTVGEGPLALGLTLAVCGAVVAVAAGVAARDAAARASAGSPAEEG